MLMVALAAELVWVALASPRFAVRVVELRGDPRVVAQIAPRLEFPGNMNLWRAPTRQLTKELEALPEVQYARVTRRFPGRLVATVERREAAAVIRTGEQPALVDSEGRVFTIRDDWGWGLPELLAPHLAGASLAGAAPKPSSGSAQPAGDVARSAARETAELLKVLRVLGRDPSLRVARLELTAGERVSAVLESGARVRLGTEEQLAAKVKLLRAALAQLGPDKIDILDLSDPAAAYWVRRQRGDGAEVKVKWPD
jgi:cell division protein FtsQ